MSAQLCQSDSDLSPSPGQPGYNTGMDFRTHFERIPGPTRRNDLREAVLPAMLETRKVADKLETMIPDDIWPLPTYREMLFIK